MSLVDVSGQFFPQHTRVEAASACWEASAASFHCWAGSSNLSESTWRCHQSVHSLPQHVTTFQYRNHATNLTYALLMQIISTTSQTKADFEHDDSGCHSRVRSKLPITLSHHPPNLFTWTCTYHHGLTTLFVYCPSSAQYRQLDQPSRPRHTQLITTLE